MNSLKGRGTAYSMLVRLNTLLAESQFGMLDLERNNDRHIHLYDLSGYWASFDRSAYQLCRLFPTSELSLVDTKGYPLPIIMAAITDATLQEYMRHHIVRREDNGRITLSVGILQDSDYRQWYRDSLQDLR